jgi:hypothetical protein
VVLSWCTLVSGSNAIKAQNEQIKLSVLEEVGILIGL